MSTYTLTGNINRYGYHEFCNIKEIGSGLVSKVYRANWIQDEKFVALKSFFSGNAITREIVHKVRKKFFQIYAQQDPELT